MNIKHLFLASALTAIATVAHAQQPPSPPVVLEADAPSVLTTLRIAGVTTVKQFDTPSGLTGWVLRDPSGNYNVVYTTADGQHLLAGALLNAQGQNLTQLYQEMHVPKPDFSELWPRIEAAGSVVMGATEDAKATVYVVFDPNCPYCDIEHRILRHYWDEGLQVRLIPVAFLRENSAGKAAALMSAEDAAAAVNEHSAKFRAGGIAVAPVTPSIKATLDANLALMRELGLTGTPALIYKDKDGKVHIEKGVSRSSKVAAITGLPVQQLTEPELAQYQ